MKKITLSAMLILVILSSSIYFMMPDNVRIDIENTKTVYSVYEGGEWVHSATEYVNLFDGSTKMRAKSRDISYLTVDTITNAYRTSLWKDNITTIDKYTFDSSVSDVEQVPIEHTFECINCVGKIVHFEYRDIVYDGNTRTATSPEIFGLRMKIEWGENEDFMWAKLYQQAVSDKLVIRFRPDTNDEIYSVRMFDPYDEITINTSTILPTILYSTTTNLLGYCKGIDTTLANVSYYYQWYKNDIIDSYGSSLNHTQNISVNIANLTISSVVGDNYTFSCLAREI